MFNFIVWHIRGMNQFTRSLATEWAHDKIRVNCVTPGFVTTDMLKKVRVHFYLMHTYTFLYIFTIYFMVPLYLLP
jgi:enoyl-[acyl-carrier-protein] reductase (NADH)